MRVFLVVACIGIVAVLGCVSRGTSPLWSSTNGATEMLNVVQQRIPVGTPIGDARRVMEEGGKRPNC